MGTQGSDMHSLPCTPCWRLVGKLDHAACCANPGSSACLLHWWLSSLSSWPSTTHCPCPCNCLGWTQVAWSWWGPWRWPSGLNTGPSLPLWPSLVKEGVTSWCRIWCWMGNLFLLSSANKKRRITWNFNLMHLGCLLSSDVNKSLMVILHQ